LDERFSFQNFPQKAGFAIQTFGLTSEFIEISSKQVNWGSRNESFF